MIKKLRGRFTTGRAGDDPLILIQLVWFCHGLLNIIDYSLVLDACCGSTVNMTLYLIRKNENPLLSERIILQWASALSSVGSSSPLRVNDTADMAAWVIAQWPEVMAKLCQVLILTC